MSCCGGFRGGGAVQGGKAARDLAVKVFLGRAFAIVCCFILLLNLILQLRPDIAVSVSLGGEGAAVIVILLLDTPGQLGSGQSHRESSVAVQSVPRSLLQIITRAEVVGRKTQPVCIGGLHHCLAVCGKCLVTVILCRKAEVQRTFIAGLQRVAVACRMADPDFYMRIGNAGFQRRVPGQGVIDAGDLFGLNVAGRMLPLGPHRCHTVGRTAAVPTMQRIKAQPSIDSQSNRTLTSGLLL